MITFSSYGYGPCVCYYSKDWELCLRLMEQFKSEGYTIDDKDEEVSEQLVKYGKEENTFITLDKSLQMYSIQIWRSPCDE